MNCRSFAVVPVVMSMWMASLAPGVLAADPADKKPVALVSEPKKASEVVQRWLDAIGGESAVRKLTNRIVKGTLELPTQGISLEMLAEAQAPDKRRSTLILPGGAGEIVSGFDGKTAWRSMPGQGVVELTGDDARALKEEAQYWEAVDFTINYSKLELAGSATVSGGDCYVVEATPSKGRVHKIYFNKKTGLIVRRDGEGPLADGTLGPTETYFEDYRSVDGMKMAFKIRRTAPQDSAFTFTTTEVTQNSTRLAGRFQKPETK